MTLAAANTFTGALNINAGTVNLNHSGAAGAGGLTLNEGVTLDNTGTNAAIMTNNEVFLNGNFTFLGSDDLNLGTGNVTLAQSLTITAGSGNLTLAGSLSDNGKTYSLTKAGNGSLVLTGNNNFGGQAEVTGGTLKFTGNTTIGLDVGVQSSGPSISSLVVQGGSFNSSGASANSNSSILVTDPGTTWTAGVDFFVGGSGTSNLTIANGAVVSDSNGHIAPSTAPTGNVVVAGTGSSWLNSNLLNIGEFGAGALTVSNGGNVSGENVFIGQQPGSNGTVLITDSGSKLSVDNVLTFGTGNLTIANGGLVTDFNASVESSVAINGPASQWQTHETITDNGTVMQQAGTVAAFELDLIAVGSTYTLQGGTLQLGQGGVQADTAGGLPDGSGNYHFNFSGGTIQFTGNSVYSNIDSTLVANQTGVIDTNGFNATWSGVISGSGALAKIGDGTLTLSGNNTYTGATNITGGILALTGNGGISSSSILSLAGGNLDVSAVNGTFAVGANQTLAGSGNIAGSATVNGALLPGAAGTVGSLGFSQDLVLGGNATTTLQIAGTTPVTQYSTVNVAGNLTAGGQLVVNFLNGFLPVAGSRFYLFLSGNSLVGAFTSEILPSLTNLFWDLTGLYRHGDIAVASATYATWVSDNGLTGNNALPNARPYSDGLPNQVRYAMNLGGATTVAQLPGTSVSNFNGTNYLTSQYRVRKNMTDIQLVPQSSNDLATWTNIDAGNITQLADDDALTARFQAQVALPNGGRVFLRVMSNQP